MQLNGLNNTNRRLKTSDNDIHLSATNNSNSQELEIEPLREHIDDEKAHVNLIEDQIIIDTSNNNHVGGDGDGLFGEKRRMVNHNNNKISSNSNVSHMPITTTPVAKTSLSLNFNNTNGNDYELRSFHENDAKHAKSPSTPLKTTPVSSNHHQANTPTSSNGLKKLFNGVHKKSKPNIFNNNNHNGNDLESDNDDDLSECYGDDILSQSLTSNNITNMQINKKSLSLSKPSLKNCIVPLSPNQRQHSVDANSSSVKRVRTTSGGSSNKCEPSTYTQIIDN